MTPADPTVLTVHGPVSVPTRLGPARRPAAGIRDDRAVLRLQLCDRGGVAGEGTPARIRARGAHAHRFEPEQAAYLVEVVDRHVGEERFLHPETPTCEDRRPEEADEGSLDSSDLAGSDKLAHRSCAPGEAQVLARHSQPSSPFRGFEERVRVVESRGQRLLDEAMESGSERLGGDRKMGRGRNGDERGVGGDGGDCVLQRAELALARKAGTLERGHVEVDDRCELPVGRSAHDSGPARAPRSHPDLDQPQRHRP